MKKHYCASLNGKFFFLDSYPQFMHIARLDWFNFGQSNFLNCHHYAVFLSCFLLLLLCSN